MATRFSNNSRIELFSLKILDEKEHYIIGRTETEVYIKTSLVGYDIIRHLKDKRVGAVKAEISKKYDDVNVDFFIRSLIRHGFVSKIDDKNVKESKVWEIKKLFSFVKPVHAEWLFSPAMITFYILIILSGIFLIIKNPQYFPSEKDYFFTSIYTILVPASFIISWLLVFVHEFAHYIAARSLNVTARFGISHRLYYIVAITDVTNIYSVERKKRLRVLSAGIIADLLIICFSIILIYLSDVKILNFSLTIYQILKFFILIEFFGLVWQFLFFMKTDIYYILEHVTGVYNLFKKAILLIHNFFSKHIKLHFESRTEKKIVQSYSLFLLFGIALTVTIAVFYYIPITIKIFKDTITNFLYGALRNNRGMFYDALIFLLFFSINSSLLLYTIIKHYKLHEKRLFYWIILLIFIASNYFIVFFLIVLILVIVNNVYLFYFLIAVFGVLCGRFLLHIFEKLNELTGREQIIVEVFVPAITIIYSFILVKLIKLFNFLALQNQNNVLIGWFYGSGLILIFITHYVRREILKIKVPQKRNI